MGNCLVTKLNGNVNNDNIYKLNEMRIYVSAGSNWRIDAAYRNLSEPVSITPISGSLIVGGVTYATGETFTLGNANYNIASPSNAAATWSISNKQAFKIIYFNSGNSYERQLLDKNFGYLSNIEHIESSFNYSPNLILGKFPKLTMLGDYTPTGFQSMPSNAIKTINSEKFPILTIINITPQNQTDIKYIAGCITLEKIFAKASLWTGSIESFAEAMLTAGRDNGSVEIWTDRNITYEGSVAENQKYKINFSSGNYTIDVL